MSQNPENSQTSTKLTHKETFLQRILGKNYKWWFIIQFYFKSNTTYRWNSAMWLASSVVIILGTILIWYINFSGKSNFEVEFSQIFTYFIIGEGLIFGSAIQFDIGENIQDGKITSRLVCPTNCLWYYIFRSFGYQFFENVSKVLIYSFFGLIFHQFLVLPIFTNFSLFILAAILAYIINTFIGIIVGLTAFWLTAFFGSASFFDSLKYIFSGRFFPLDSLKILQFTFFTPFAFTFYHPMQIYLGKYSPNQTGFVFIGGIFWAILLYFLAKFIFKMGLKKNESVGL